MSKHQSLNLVQVMGRLGKDPEARAVGEGNTVVNFSMATDEGYYNKSSQWIEATEWHRITVWGKQAEKCRDKVRKGDVVMVIGKLKTDSWDDPNNPGSKKYSTSIVASQVKHVNDQGRAAAIRANGGQPLQQNQPMAAPAGMAEDDLPF